MKTESFAEILEFFLEKKNLNDETSNSTNTRHSKATTQTSSTFQKAVLSDHLSLEIEPLNFNSSSRLKFKNLSKYGSLRIQTDQQAFNLRDKTIRMTPSQREAYENLFFALELPPLEAHRLLPENYNLAQLKVAFRKAALRKHPDTGGEHESFLQIKKSYETLAQFVKNSEQCQ